jgi:hypothetical protein
MLTKQFNITDRFYSIISFKPYTMSLWNILILLFRFNWILILIIIHETLLYHRYLSNYTKHYQLIKQKFQVQYRNNYLKYPILMFSILIGPFLLEIVLFNTSLILWPLSKFIRYGWLISLILLSEYFIDYEYSSHYIQRYLIIKQNIQDWCSAHRIKREFPLLIVFALPFLLETSVFYFLHIWYTKFYFIWKPLVFIIRYNWLVLTFLLDNILISHKYFPNLGRKYQKIKMDIDDYLSKKFSSKYRKTKQELHHWYNHDTLRSRIIIFSILIGPLLLELLFLNIIPISKLFLFCTWKLFLFTKRYCWILFIIIISEFILVKYNYFPYYTRVYKSIINETNNWKENNQFKFGIILISIFGGQFILEMCFIWFPTVIKLFLFLIRYSWILLITIISEILEEKNVFPFYSEKHKSIKRKMEHWCRDSKLKVGIIIVSILAGPFILEQCCVWFIPIMKLLIFLIWNLFLFLIHYCWFLMIIIINKILEENKIFPDYYIEKYMSIENKINYWSRDSKLKVGIVIIMILIIPALLDQCPIGSTSINRLCLFCITRLFLFVIRYCWILLITIISEILEEKNVFPNYSEKHKSIKRKMEHWSRDSKLKVGIIIVSILAGPFILEQCCVLFIPIMKLLIFLIWNLFLFLIRYCWILIILCISTILEENGVFPVYIEKYKAVKTQVYRWSGNNKWKKLLILFPIILGPFLLEIFCFYVLKAIISTIILFLKRSFFYLASIFVFYCLFRLIYH